MLDALPRGSEYVYTKGYPGPHRRWLVKLDQDGVKKRYCACADYGGDGTPLICDMEHRDYVAIT